MSLYMLHDECQVFGKSVGVAPLSLLNIYMGLGVCGMSLHVDAWHVHQCEHGKGKGTKRMLMLLSPCSAAQVMGLEGCVGVHSTSRPPQIKICFR